MTDGKSLKARAKESLRGAKPSAYLIASAYVAAFGVLSSLAYVLSGLDQTMDFLRRAVTVDPFISAETFYAALPPVGAPAVLLFIAVVAARFLTNAGYASWCLKTSRGEQAGFKSLADGFALFWKLLRLQLLRAGLIILGGLLLIAPGVIAYYALRQAVYVQLDDPKARPVDCLRASYRLMHGHKAELFRLDVTFIGWFAIEVTVRIIATLRLFSVWLAPYLGLTRAGFYNALVGRGAR